MTLHSSIMILVTIFTTAMFAIYIIELCSLYMYDIDQL